MGAEPKPSAVALLQPIRNAAFGRFPPTRTAGMVPACAHIGWLALEERRNHLSRRGTSLFRVLATTDHDGLRQRGPHGQRPAGGDRPQGTARRGPPSAGSQEARSDPCDNRLMCRNITTLRGLDPPATPEEVVAAARQYVRKVSGVQAVSASTHDAVEQAVQQVAAATVALLAALPDRRQPPPTVPPLRRLHRGPGSPTAAMW